MFLFHAGKFPSHQPKLNLKEIVFGIGCMLMIPLRYPHLPVPTVSHRMMARHGPHELPQELDRNKKSYPYLRDLKLFLTNALVVRLA